MEKNISDRLFWPFGLRLIENIEQQLNQLADSILSPTICHELALQAEAHRRMLYTRCLISEMHSVKEQGGLQGADSRAEYEDYLQRYLMKQEYVNGILEKYPVLVNLIQEKIIADVAYVAEIIAHLRADWSMIQAQFVVTEKNRQSELPAVTAMTLYLSDEHVPGKSVAKIILDDEIVLYHKPKSLQVHDFYQKVSAWFMKKCQCEAFEYPVWCQVDYGWEMEIKAEACTDAGMLAQYYRKLGIHLFVSYMLGVSDLHFENIIAHGDCPVMTDVEFLADRRIRPADVVADIRERLQDTVQNTGMLPSAGWLGGAADVGGIGHSGDQKMPFKMPLIVHPKTSEMAIDYDYLVMKADTHLPQYKGEGIDFRAYAADFVGGFVDAYEVAMKDKGRFFQQFEKRMPDYSRFLLRNTQVYFMYQNLMTMPELMADRQMREQILMHMARDLVCPAAFREKILQYEMACIDHAVIPVFYAVGYDLHMGNGTVLEHFFEMNQQSWFDKRNSLLSKQDKTFQVKVMETRLFGTLVGLPDWKGHIFLEMPRLCEVSPAKIANRLLSEAFLQNRNQPNVYRWAGVNYQPSGGTWLDGIDDYLYQGIAGITLFFAAINAYEPSEQYKALLTTLTQQLRVHTNIFTEEKKINPKRKMGLFTGESSIVYTYLLLYEITGEDAYLALANQQGQRLMAYTDCIEADDLLEGKAGVMQAFVKLYVATENVDYLNQAQKLAGQLLAGRVQADSYNKIDVEKSKDDGFKTGRSDNKALSGFFWENAGHRGLGGMAHGCSGIALAFATLWQVTKYTAYLDVVRAALAYEDTLFSHEKCNWMDIREADNAQDGKDMAAWCHGIGGIFAARMRIHALTELTLTELFLPLAEEAKTQAAIVDSAAIDQFILKQLRNRLASEKRTNMCLCHGNVGLVDMLAIGIEKSELGLLATKMSSEQQRLSLEDVYNPGMMTGLAGIGYGLLRLQHPELPDILSVL